MKRTDLQTDTTLLPAVIADCVVREGCSFVPALIDEKRARDVADRLAARADRCYLKHQRFARHLRSRSGRDVLYAFMRHWLASIALAEFGVTTPPAFANGLQVSHARALGDEQ